MNNEDLYEGAIHDAERRIGSHIVGGGKIEDSYVQQQLAKINQWYFELDRLRQEADNGKQDSL